MTALEWQVQRPVPPLDALRGVHLSAAEHATWNGWPVSACPRCANLAANARQALRALDRHVDSYTNRARLKPAV